MDITADGVRVPQGCRGGVDDDLPGAASSFEEQDGGTYATVLNRNQRAFAISLMVAVVTHERRDDHSVVAPAKDATDEDHEAWNVLN